MVPASRWLIGATISAEARKETMRMVEVGVGRPCRWMENGEARYNVLVLLPADEREAVSLYLDL